MSQYVDTNEYYGEDTSLLGHAPQWVTHMVATGQCPAEVGEIDEKCPNFFKIIVDFTKLYNKAHEDNEAREKQMHAAARAKARAEAKAAGKPLAKTPRKEEAPPEDEVQEEGKDPVKAKMNLQQQIAMKAAAKLKQMKAKKQAEQADVGVLPNK